MIHGYSTPYNAWVLYYMFEKWRKTLDKGDCFGALLIDPSKAFDSLLHDLLIAKWHGYGFDMNFSKVVYNYLNDRK